MDGHQTEGQTDRQREDDSELMDASDGFLGVTYIPIDLIYPESQHDTTTLLP